MISYESWNLKDFVREERLKQLKEVLEGYSELLTKEGEIKDQMINAFIFKKPLTSIELFNEDSKVVHKFMEELESFFLVAHALYEDGLGLEIFVSRNKDFLDTMKYHVSKNQKEHGGFLSRGFLDEIADISGLLFGYSPQDVARHCLKELPKKYYLIK